MTNDDTTQTYTTENAVRDICSIETVQYASKSEVRKIVERLANQKLKEGMEIVEKSVSSILPQ